MPRQLLPFAISIVLLSFSSPSFAQDSTRPDAPPPPDEKDRIFEKVEVDAKVDFKAWHQHLIASLPAYLEHAAQKGMKAGTYVINVRFIVERNGSITNVTALNDPGYNLAKGAIITVRTGPRWMPAEQNGYKVRSYHTQPITFQISEK